MQKDRKMTRTEALAKAFDGYVKEDHAYWGILITDDGTVLRYQAMHGVDRVTKNGKNWRRIQNVMTPDEIDDFLLEAKIINKPPEEGEMTTRLAALLQGEVIQCFATGGGVIRVRGRHLRVSPVSGVTFVRRALARWRVTDHIWTKDELYNILNNTTTVKHEGTLEDTLQCLRKDSEHGYPRIQRDRDSGSAAADSEEPSPSEGVPS